MRKRNHFEKDKREGDREEKFRERRSTNKRPFSSAKPNETRSRREKEGFREADGEKPYRGRPSERKSEPNTTSFKKNYKDTERERPYRSRYSDRNLETGAPFFKKNAKVRDDQRAPKDGFAPRKPYGRQGDPEVGSRPPKKDFIPRTFRSEAIEQKRPNPTSSNSGKDLIRLNRYIANAGICSRREADELIDAGQISVNGKVITEMGYKVKPTDIVKYGKRVLNPEKLVYILLNKPKGFLTTTEDPEDRKTVLDLIQGACEERVYPVGRLDRNTTGLLLITNDGELADKLTHPSNNIRKIYQAELDKPLSLEDFEAIKAGVELEDGFIKPDDLGIVTPDAYVVGIEIHSGRNRIVRRIFEHFNYEVKKLDRTVFAGLTKKDLPRGKWRFLTQKEIVALKFLT